jgi:F5/8 type C domain
MTHQRPGRRHWHAAAGVALAATLATVASSLAPSISPAFAAGNPSAASDALPSWGTTLAEVQAEAAQAISVRLAALQAAIKTVQGESFLGADATTLVNEMQADITGLQALGTKIAADTSVSQAITDADLIFTQFRVYYVMLPVVHDVTSIDYIVNVDVPALTKDIATLQGEENSSNQPFIAPLISGMQSEAQIATGATTGLSAQLLAYTPAEWDSNHRLFSTAQTAIQTGQRAVNLAVKDWDRANAYLRSHPTTTTTTTSTTTTSSTTSTTAPTTTTTTAVPGSNCAAGISGTALGRTGWSATTNAPSSKSDAPANALDGNLTSRFSTDEHQVPGLYFEVNFGSAQTFDEVVMATPNSPNDYARGYQVMVSSTGSSWTTVANCTGTATPEVVSFPTQTAQYIEVILTASNSSWWWSIDEFDVYTNVTPPTTTSTTTTTVPPTTTTTPGQGRQLQRIKDEAAYQISIRVRELAGAIKGVQDRPWLGADGTTLINDMQSDINGLEALGNKIQGDMTVSQALADYGLIFSQYRVYAFEDPVVSAVIRADRVTDISLPNLAKSIAKLQSEENQSNQGVLAPLIANMQQQSQIAANAVSGLSATLLSYTVAEWNANHGLLNGAIANLRVADRALQTAQGDLNEANNYLSHHHGHSGGGSGIHGGHGHR